MTESREARLLEIPSLGRDALRRLRRLRVAVIGAGTLGGQIITHLALLGIRLCIVDSGRVDPPNLGTQVLPAESVGLFKAEVRARQILELNPEANVSVLTSRVEDLGLAALSDCDLFVVGLDSWTARMHVDEVSLRLQKPWIDAALDGSGARLFGQITAYDPRRHDSACYACKFDESALREISREQGGDACPSWRRQDTPVTEPTLQTSSLAAIVAGYQALWALRFLLGGGDDLVNRQLLIDCDASPRIRLIGIERSRRCRHHVDGLTPLRPSNALTVGALARQAREDLGDELEQLQFHNRTLARGLRCGECAQERDLVRMSHAYTDAEVQCSCRPGVEMAPVELLASLSRTHAAHLADLRWSDLGVPARDVVTARSADRQAHYVINDPEMLEPTEAARGAQP